MYISICMQVHVSISMEINEYMKIKKYIVYVLSIFCLRSVMDVDVSIYIYMFLLYTHSHGYILAKRQEMTQT